MKSKHFIVVSVIALAIAAGIFLYRSRPFAVLDAGGGYTFRFYSRAPGLSDDMPANYHMLDYELVRDGRAVFREAFGCTTTPPDTLELLLLTSPDHRVVAIVERTAPDIVFLVYDFDSGESSRQAFSETHTPALERVNRLLARIQPGVQQTLIMRDQVQRGAGRVTKL